MCGVKQLSYRLFTSHQFLQHRLPENNKPFKIILRIQYQTLKKRSFFHLAKYVIEALEVK